MINNNLGEKVQSWQKQTLPYYLNRVSQKLMVQVVTGVCIIFACAQAKIDLYPVPITLHSIGVLIIGLLYSVRAAKYIPCLYLTLGGMGIPVFAGYSGGLAYLFGPTGGFLFGFVFSIWIMVYLRHKMGESSLYKLVVCGLVGIAMIFGLGVAWLAHLTNLTYAIQVGLKPFLWIEPLKAIITALIIYPVKKCFRTV